MNTVSGAVGLSAQLYIDGQWAPAASGQTFPVYDPSDGSVIGVAADAGPPDVAAAIAAASAAFSRWRSVTAYERADALHRAHALMTERLDQLAELMSLEQGKPLKAARNEVSYGADFLRWFAEEATRVYGMKIPSPRANQRLSVLRQPVGVVAAITPWNYPVSMITRKVAPAVAAGCTVILKPAEQTPLCARAMFEIFHDAGFPPGVVNLLSTSDPAPLGSALLAAREVRKLTFTGSTEVGKQLAGAAAGTMKRVSMELGGHAPFIVFPDADPVRAAKGAALVKFLNTGQACISPNRIFVHSSVADDFVATLAERVRALQPGPGRDPRSTIGPLIDSAAMAKMERHVDDATTRGAKVVVGGHRYRDCSVSENGLFFEPTLLTGVTREMAIFTEETFGPIAAVTTFETESEVIAAANDTVYGLAAYVYTDDLGVATRVTEQLNFGIVGINDINPTAAAAPFGGIGESGLGREGGPQGIDEYLDVKLIGQAL